MSETPELMTLQQARDYAQVTKNTLRKWERHGLRVTRYGSIVRVYKADLDAFLRATPAARADVVSSPISARTAPEHPR